MDYFCRLLFAVSPQVSHAGFSVFKNGCIRDKPVFSGHLVGIFWYSFHILENFWYQHIVWFMSHLLVMDTVSYHFLFSSKTFKSCWMSVNLI